MKIADNFDIQFDDALSVYQPVILTIYKSLFLVNDIHVSDMQQIPSYRGAMKIARGV